MNSKDIYNNLIAQYEQLNLVEKQAILIYKSKLFNLEKSIICYTFVSKEPIA